MTWDLDMDGGYENGRSNPPKRSGRKTLTYGTLPTREEFGAAFERECKREYAEIAGERCFSAPIFAFTNDPRVGTVTLTCSELWRELNDALIDYRECGQPAADTAGQWCSDVLGVLGFEWV